MPSSPFFRSFRPFASLAGAAVALFVSLAPRAAAAEVVVHVPGDQATLTAAIAAVPNGGTIELAGGTYASPVGGFVIANLAKGFTVRGAPLAVVNLDGGGARIVLKFENSSLGSGRPVVFENLVFENGSSPTSTFAGGVTVRRAEATFVDCAFINNQRLETAGNEFAGGGLGVSGGSRVFIARSTFTANRVKNNGGGISISESSTVYVHASEFHDNLTNVASHRNNAAGGAISNINARLFVTNSRFEGNRSGYVAGAIYTYGAWIDPVATPSAETTIADCTFVDNRAVANGVATPGPTEAGAVHAEDQATMRIFGSRFAANVAQTGGAVNLYRALVEVDDSAFEGNVADGAVQGGFGGTFNLISNDTVVDGATNRRSGSLTLRRSYVRGSLAPTVTEAKTGGCLAAAGDFQRRIGNVAPQGSAAATRATLVVEDTVFHDCDVTATNLAAGGGFDVYLTDASLTDAMVIGSDALNPNSSGGGGRMTTESTGTVDNVTFARNSAVFLGAALYLQGADVDVTGSRFLFNEISPGTAELISQSLGAAIFSGGQDDWPTAGIKLNMLGTVSTTLFSENIGLPVWDDDRNGAGNWINDLRWNSDTFYNTTFGTDVYTDSLAQEKNAAELNTLVIVRTQGNTDKSQSDNSQPGAAPISVDLRIVPPEILQTVAAGDTESTSESYAAFAWGGGAATFDGGGVAGNIGVISVGAGVHTLSVGASDAVDGASLAPLPEATLTATPDSIALSQSSLLAWQATSGDFLALGIDQAVGTALAATGSQSVTPVATTTYRLFLVSEQGGEVREVTVYVDTLFADGFESGDSSRWSATFP